MKAHGPLILECPPLLCDRDHLGYGNVLAATAFLHGLAEQELRPAELDVHDPNCLVLVAGHAVKALEPL